MSYEKLHLRNLLVNFLHELYYKIDQLVLEHLFGMEIRNKKRYIITLPCISSYSLQSLTDTNLDRFPSQNKECLSSLGQETREFVHQDVFNLVGLLYPYADPDTVDTRLDEDTFVLVAGDREGIEEDFR